ncbi:helix-turn-helix domain-containing protein [Kitasatospora sp. NBC_00315]
MFPSNPPPPAADGLGELIRTYRHRAGMTQRQLADLSALSVRSIRDLEAGRVRRPRHETARLLADALRLAEPQRRAMEQAALRLPIPDEPAATEREQPPALGPIPLALATPDGAIIGREDELQWLTRALGFDRQCIVSVVGVSGVGSSRLALEASCVLRDELGWPVLWLDARHLSPAEPSGIGWEVPEPPPLLRQVVRILTGRAEHAAGAWAEVLPLLGVGNSVLVLDGLIRGQVPGDRLTELLQRCPGLRVVTTGLEPIAVQGEQVLALAPLPVPGPAPAAAATGAPGAIASASAPSPDAESPDAEVPGAEALGGGTTDAGAPAAVRLFATHMRRVRPGFALDGPRLEAVLELCRLLEGIPRAITYAAEWCLMYSPQQLLDHLRADPLGLSAPSSVSGPSLRASLRRTFDALEPEPALLLRCLAGLPGPWTLEDAHVLVGGTLAGLSRAVHQLMVRGLVRHCGYEEEDRFTVPPLLRLALSHRPADGPL